MAIYGLYCLTFLLHSIEVYVYRSRRKICAIFYPNTEKIRVIFFYTRLLCIRKCFIETLEKKITDLRYEPEIQGKKFEIFNSLPWIWYKFFGKSKKCCVCAVKLTKKSYFECPNRHCELLYCDFCWDDIGKTCLKCTPRTL